MSDKRKELNKSMQIRVSQTTYQKLVTLGNLEDTFDSVIQKLLPHDKQEVTTAN